MATNKNLTIINPLADSGVRIINASLPEFLPELNRLLDAQGIAKIQPLLSEAAIIANDSPNYVWSFTVVFTFPDQIAPSGNPWRHVINASLGGASVHELLFAPGSRYLVTPIPGFRASRTASGTLSVRPDLDPSMDGKIQNFLSQHSPDTELARVALDSVIFEDGTLQGPDTENMQQEVNDKIRAHNDFAAMLDGLHGNALKAKLDQLANSASDSHYSRRLGSLADLYQQVLQSRGEDQVVQEVSAMKNRTWFSNSKSVRRKTP